MYPNGVTTKEVRSVIRKPPEFDQEVNLLIAAGWVMLGTPVSYDVEGNLRVTMVRREAPQTAAQANRNFKASGNTSFKPRKYVADGR
jgi:hypothetical protein